MGMFDELNNEVRKKDKVQKMIFKGDGVFRFRLIPHFASKKLIPFIRMFFHGGFIYPSENPEEMKAGTYRCIGKECPMCDEVREMYNQKAPDAWKFRSRPNHLYYVLDKNNRVQFISVEDWIQDDILKQLMKLDKENPDFFKIHNGVEVELKAETIEGKRKWTCRMIPEETKDLQENTLKRVQALGSLYNQYKIYSADELQAIIEGRLFNEKDLETEVPVEESRSNVIRLVDNDPEMLQLIEDHSKAS